MFSPTWTIDDLAPLGPVETAKAAGRWVAARLVRIAAEIVPKSMLATRQAHQLCAGAVKALRHAHAPRASRLSTAQSVHTQASHVRAASPMPAREVLSAVMAARMADSQWARCSDTIAQAIARTEVVARHQSAALQKLDLAQYGLSSLKIELAAVMAIPGFEGKASLHRLPARSMRTAAIVSSGSAAAA